MLLTLRPVPDAARRADVCKHALVAGITAANRRWPRSCTYRHRGLQEGVGLRDRVYEGEFGFAFTSTNPCLTSLLCPQTRYVYNKELVFMITSTEMSLSFNYVYKHEFGFSFTSTNTPLTSILCLRTRVTSTEMSLTSL